MLIRPLWLASYLLRVITSLCNLVKECVNLQAVKFIMPVFVSRGGEGPTPDQGIRAGIIPELLDIPMLDCIMTVPSDEALDKAFWLASPQVLHLPLLFR